MVIIKCWDSMQNLYCGHSYTTYIGLLLDILVYNIFTLSKQIIKIIDKKPGDTSYIHRFNACSDHKFSLSLFFV